MIWVLVLACLVGASVYGAHRLLAGMGEFGAVGRVPRGLVYAAAVVLGCQATDAAINIRQVTDGGELRLSSSDEIQAIVQVLSGHIGAVAWQAGLLLAAAALVAATTVRRPH